MKDFPISRIDARRICGFTIIELMIALAVLGVLLIIAVPSFSNTLKRHRLIGATEALQQSLVYAKSEALNRSQAVTLTVKRSSITDWCFGISVSSAACDCTIDDITNVASCKVDDSLKVVRSSSYRGVTSSPVADDSVTFSPARGETTAKQIDFEASNSGGLAMRVIVTGLGMVRLCSPGGGGKVYGFEDC